MTDPSTPTSREKKVFVFGWIPAAGTMSPTALVPLMALLEKSNLQFSDAFDAVHGASSGAMIAAGLSIPDPKDPSKPLTTPAAMLKDQIDNTWRVIPGTMPEDLPQGPSGFFTRLAARGQVLFDQFKAIAGIPTANDKIGTFFEDRGAKARLEESMLTLGIAAHSVGPDKYAGQVDFVNVKSTRKDLPLRTDAPDGIRPYGAKMSMRDSLLASTALATVFGAHPVEVEGKLQHFLDYGAIASPIPMLARIKNSLPPDTKIIFIKLGIVQDENPFPTTAHSLLGSVFPFRRVAEQTNVENTMQTARAMLGSDNVFDLSPNMPGFYRNYHQPLGGSDYPNSMDGSSSAQRAWVKIAEHSVRENAPLIDRAAELCVRRAKQAKGAPAP